MARFKNDDKIRIIRGQYTGQTGTIAGRPERIPFALPTVVGEGQELTGEEKVSYIYQVDLDHSDWTVSVAELELAHT